MIQHAERGSVSDAHIPVWRRITAMFTLSTVVIMGGMLIALFIAATALTMLFVLERAIAG